MHLSLVLFNTSGGKYSIRKKSKYTAVYQSVNSETHCVPLLCLSSRFITCAPSSILGKMSLEKSKILEILSNLDIS